jgi:small conductance mechanosensitive channel
MTIVVANALTETLSSFTLWLDQNLAHLISAVIIFFSAIIVTKLFSQSLARLLARTVREDMFPTKVDRDRRLQTLNSITVAVVTFGVWAVAAIMILNTLGINTAPLLASAGILTVALGFGAQSLVRDFVTGMFIIAENQYRIGDYIEIQNIKGTVKSITMRTTVVKDDAGSVFHIPNGSIVTTGNHTMGNNKISIVLSVAGDTNLEKLRDIINKTGLAQSKDQVQQEFITEPIHFSRIKDVAGAAVVVHIFGKVRAGKQVDVRSDFLFRLQSELTKHKIELK